MKMKKYLACLLAAMMMAGAAVACGNKTADSVAETEAQTEATTEETTEAETETTTEEEAIEITQADVEFEEAKDAQDGQAYLAIVDGQWWIQYWGSSTDGKGYMLAYDAGIADINGDGTYTVSVTADTNGFRYDTTGDVADQYTPEGLSFMAIMIPNGTAMYPDAVITIDSIKVDGNEIEMTAKNYTSSDDGIELRSNIFNSYVSAPSGDARSTEGALYDADGNALDICADYSAQVVDTADFSQWTNVEVTFTITGTGAEGGAAADDAADADADAEAETDADAEAETDADAEGADSSADAE